MNDESCWSSGRCIWLVVQQTCRVRIPASHLFRPTRPSTDFWCKISTSLGLRSNSDFATFRPGCFWMSLLVSSGSCRWRTFSVRIFNMIAVSMSEHVHVCSFAAFDLILKLYCIVMVYIRRHVAATSREHYQYLRQSKRGWTAWRSNDCAQILLSRTVVEAAMSCSW